MWVVVLRSSSHSFSWAEFRMDLFTDVCLSAQLCSAVASSFDWAELCTMYVSMWFGFRNGCVGQASPP